MARTQRNKNTSFHLGQLKAKLAKLKRELLTPTGGGGGGGGGKLMHPFQGGQMDMGIFQNANLDFIYSWLRCRTYWCC